jgi:hypothetical protein
MAAQSEQRKERLAAALRTNLRRRKAASGRSPKPDAALKTRSGPAPTAKETGSAQKREASNE